MTAESSDRFDLAGQVAVVTGAGSRWIGRGLVHGLAAAGAAVVIVDRSTSGTASAGYITGCQINPNSGHCLGLVQVPDASAFLRLNSILDSGLRRNDGLVDSASTFIAIDLCLAEMTPEG